MIPVLKSLQRRGIPFDVVDTWQHNGLPTSILSEYGISANRLVDLPSGDYEAISHGWAKGVLPLIEEIPDFICVQGDTSSAYAGAKLSLLLGCPLYYIEAGLRSFDNSNPFPEEIIRKRISFEAALNFAPSEKEVANLRDEAARGVFLTGNTFPDFLEMNRSEIKQDLIIITIHRRENLPILLHIFDEIKKCCEELPQYQFLFPVHPNPVIVETSSTLAGISNLRLCKPLKPREFQLALSSSRAVITDSGGVEEESGLLGIPALVVRWKTERAGTYLFPPDGYGMAGALKSLLEMDPPLPDERYGKGGAGEKIVGIMEEQLYGKH